MIFHRSRGPQARQKSVPQERAASPTRLFKGGWGRCHQQADWTSRPRREVQSACPFLRSPVSLVPVPYSKGASTEAIKYADAILV